MQLLFRIMAQNYSWLRIIDWEDSFVFKSVFLNHKNTYVTMIIPSLDTEGIVPNAPEKEMCSFHN